MFGWTRIENPPNAEWRTTSCAVSIGGEIQDLAIMAGLLGRLAFSYYTHDIVGMKCERVLRLARILSGPGQRQPPSHSSEDAISIIHCVPER